MLFVDYPVDHLGGFINFIYPVPTGPLDENHSPIIWSHFRHPDSESPWKHAIHIGVILVSFSFFIIMLYVGIFATFIQGPFLPFIITTFAGIPVCCSLFLLTGIVVSLTN